jgi:hypothetical protein
MCLYSSAVKRNRPASNLHLAGFTRGLYESGMLAPSVAELAGQPRLQCGERQSTYRALLVQEDRLRIPTGFGKGTMSPVRCVSESAHVREEAG